MSSSDLKWLSEICNDMKHCAASLWQLSFLLAIDIVSQFRYLISKASVFSYIQHSKAVSRKPACHLTRRIVQSARGTARPIITIATLYCTLAQSWLGKTVYSILGTPSFVARPRPRPRYWGHCLKTVLTLKGKTLS